ncbi:RNA polymerase sigma factor [Roseibium algae]|uniref:RNA polymerase sigma factor n=1 Tax=Roseibium algae TaxID=3123038 RepID=A0ABU8TEY9_9HYPH
MTWDLHKLFQKHSREINRFLRRRGHTPETAADLTHDTFLRVLVSAPKESEGEDNPRAYLFKVSKNISLNYQRRERLVRFADLDGDDVGELVDPAPSAETVVYSRQCLDQVEVALAELPERTRKAFEMSRLGERTIADISKELNLSKTRTWGLIHEAYRHLLKRVDDF